MLILRKDLSCLASSKYWLYLKLIVPCHVIPVDSLHAGELLEEAPLQLVHLHPSVLLVGSLAPLFRQSKVRQSHIISQIHHHSQVRPVVVSSMGGMFSG